MTILLVFLLVWKSYSFRIREELHWNVSDYVICYAQDIILWTILYIINYFSFILLGKRFYIAHLIILNSALVFQMIDSRVKVLFLEPLSIELIKYSYNDLSILLSQILFFWGKKYWPAFLISILVHNIFPPLISSILEKYNQAKPEINGHYKFMNSIIYSRKWLVFASAICLLSIIIVASSQEEIYGLNKNFIISSFMTAHKSVRRNNNIHYDSEQKVCSLKNFNSGYIDNKYFGLAGNKNIILYILESTSYEDSLGMNKGNMPFINSLLGDGGLGFECYAQCATSTKSVFTILSGLHSSRGFEIIESRIRKIGGIAKALKGKGYFTAFITAQDMSYQGMRNMVRNFGFDHFAEYEDLRSIAKHKGIVVKNAGFGASDDKLMLLDDIKKFLCKKTFIVFYTSSSHFPYDFPGANSDIDKDRHYQSLLYADHVFSLLYKSISENNMLNNTLFVVTADHGEEFYSGKFKGRGATLSEATHKVPLLFYGAGIKFPKTKNAHARQVDICISLLELLGVVDCDFCTQGIPIFSPDYHKTPVFINTYGLMDNMGIIENEKKYIYSFDSNKMWLSEFKNGKEFKTEINDSEKIYYISSRMNNFAGYNSYYLEMLLSSD